MEVSRIRALRGPNLWSRHTSIEAIVTLTPEEYDLGTAYFDRLRERFPEIGHQLRNSGIENRSLADALRYAALALQVNAGCNITFSRTTQTVEEGVYQVVVEYTEEPVGRLALELGETLCRAAANNTVFDLAGALARLRELDEDERLGPSTGCIADAALARGRQRQVLQEHRRRQPHWPAPGTSNRFSRSSDGPRRHRPRGSGGSVEVSWC